MAENLRAKYCGEAGGQGPSPQHPRFPRSVCEGHWITSPSEHEDHPGQSLVTCDHAVILQWAGQRSAMPATIRGTRHDGHLGVLRFDFPNWGSRESLEHVTWEEWFGTLDDRELVMLYQEKMENGEQSNFCHFNSPDREHM